MRGCTPGLVHRWLWFEWPESELPAEGDIAIRRSTGSCWLVLSIKPSRKGGHWFTAKVEGLGVGAAEVEDEGTFTVCPLSHEDYESIRLIEAADRLDSGATV